MTAEEARAISNGSKAPDWRMQLEEVYELIANDASMGATCRYISLEIFDQTEQQLVDDGYTVERGQGWIRIEW